MRPVSGKDRLVFDCSFYPIAVSPSMSNLSLVQHLDPPSSGSSFTIPAVCYCHQWRYPGNVHLVYLLPEDHPLLRFIWRNLYNLLVNMTPLVPSYHIQDDQGSYPDTVD